MTKRLLLRMGVFASFALLFLLCIYFASIGYIRESELDRLRKESFARGYECLVAYLSEYSEVDPVLSGDRVAMCFTFLPLDEDGREISRKFLADIRLSKSDAKASSRAVKYKDILLDHLTLSRAQAYGEWAGSTLPLPEYPSEDEASLPAYTMPKEEEGLELEKSARALLSEEGKLVRYERKNDNGGTVIGFRSSYSFAEYDDGTGLLKRALIYRRTGTGDIGKSIALSRAKMLLEEQKYRDLELVSMTKDRGCYVAVFSGELYEVTLGLGEDSAELCFFNARERKSPDGK